MLWHFTMNIKEAKARGWDEVDFVYVMGDSYVDHPVFGAAIITRGLRTVAIRLQSFLSLIGKMMPIFTQLEFGNQALIFVTAGNIDGMGCTLYRCKA